MSQAEVSTTILVEVVAECGDDGNFPFPIQHAMTQILLALRGQKGISARSVRGFDDKAERRALEERDAFRDAFATLQAELIERTAVLRALEKRVERTEGTDLDREKELDAAAREARLQALRDAQRIAITVPPGGPEVSAACARIIDQYTFALEKLIFGCAHPKIEAPAPVVGTEAPAPAVGSASEHVVAVGNVCDRVALIGANDGRCGYYNPIEGDWPHRSTRCPNQAYAYVFKGSDPKNPITLACLDHADELVENGAAWRRGERLPRLTPRPGIVLPSEERSS